MSSESVCAYITQPLCRFHNTTYPLSQTYHQTDIDLERNCPITIMSSPVNAYDHHIGAGPSTDPKAVKKIEKKIEHEAKNEEKMLKSIMKDLSKTEKAEAKADTVSLLPPHSA